MRIAIIVPLAAGFALAACGKAGPGSDTAASGANPAPAQAAASLADVRFEPGLYEMKTEIKSFDMPGLPPAAIAAMKGSLAGKAMTYCLTAEDAAKGMAAMKERMSKGQCTFNRFDAANGKLDTDMTCQMGEGSLHTVGHGTYSGTGTVMASTADMAMPQGRKMHVEQVTTTRRVGECTK